MQAKTAKTVGTLAVLGAMAGTTAVLMGFAHRPSENLAPPVLSNPEGTVVSRGLTPQERSFLAANPDYFANQGGNRRGAEHGAA